MCEKSNHRNYDGVPELLVGLCVRHWYNKFVRVAHEPRAFARCEATWLIFLGLDKDFRAVLVITGAQSAGRVLGTELAEAEAVAKSLMLLGVFLQVFPKVRRQRVLVVYCPGFEDR